MNPAPFYIHSTPFIWGYMYHIYLLKSKRNSSLYIGYTNDIKRRLEEHNKGLVGYTKRCTPWALIYYESFLSLEDAKARENSLKYFGKAYGQLKHKISNSLNLAPLSKKKKLNSKRCGVNMVKGAG